MRREYPSEAEGDGVCALVTGATVAGAVSTGADVFGVAGVEGAWPVAGVRSGVTARCGAGAACGGVTCCTTAAGDAAWRGTSTTATTAPATTSAAAPRSAQVRGLMALFLPFGEQGLGPRCLRCA